MGRGDARLIVVLSLWNEVWHSWGALAVVIVSFALHTVYVVWRAFTCRITLHTRHALGPWLVAGFWPGLRVHGLSETGRIVSKVAQ